MEMNIKNLFYTYVGTPILGIPKPRVMEVQYATPPGTDTAVQATSKTSPATLVASQQTHLLRPSTQSPPQPLPIDDDAMVASVPTPGVGTDTPETVMFGPGAVVPNSTPTQVQHVPEILSETTVFGTPEPKEVDVVAKKPEGLQGHRYSILTNPEKTRRVLAQNSVAEQRTLTEPVVKAAVVPPPTIKPTNKPFVTPSYFIPVNAGRDDAGYMVVYKDSYLAVSEGYGYGLSQMVKKPNAQEAFDRLIKGTESILPKVGSDILAWRSSDPHSAADADAERVLNFYRASENVATGMWIDTGMDYDRRAKSANEAFLNNAVIYAKDSAGNPIAIPTSGYSATAPNKSYFVKQDGDSIIFQYNPSYSFAYAAAALKNLDPRWATINSTQITINTMILKELGMVDWCIVKLNEKTGDISVSNELDQYFPNRSNGHTVEAKIEWPRLIIDHGMNVLRNNDKESLAFLKLIKNKYGTDLNGLTFAGYRNDLVLSMVRMMKVIFNEAKPSDIARLNEDALTDTKYTFNHFLINKIAYAVNENQARALLEAALAKDVRPT